MTGKLACLLAAALVVAPAAASAANPAQPPTSQTGESVGTPTGADPNNNPDAVVLPADLPYWDTAPRVSGRPVVGRTLRCHTGTWVPSLSVPDSTFSYGWSRHRFRIKGASSDRYKLRRADAGHRVACVTIAVNWTGVYTVRGPGVEVTERASRGRTAR